MTRILEECSRRREVERRRLFEPCVACTSKYQGCAQSRWRIQLPIESISFEHRHGERRRLPLALRSTSRLPSRCSSTAGSRRHGLLAISELLSVLLALAMPLGQSRVPPQQVPRVSFPDQLTFESRRSGLGAVMRKSKFSESQIVGIHKAAESEYPSRISCGSTA